jgi:hypothetical protein
MAEIGSRSVSGLSSMRSAFEFPKERELFEIDVVYFSHFKDIVGTYFDAIPFALAAILIYDGFISSRLGPTFFAGPFGMICCKFRLCGIEVRIFASIHFIFCFIFHGSLQSRV